MPENPARRLLRKLARASRERPGYADSKVRASPRETSGGKADQANIGRAHRPVVALAEPSGHADV